MSQEFYSAISQTQQFKIKERYLDNDPESATCNILRESIRNAIGFNADNIFLVTIINPDNGDRYIVILHNGDAFASEEQMKRALEPNKSSRQGASYFGNGGKQSALLGDVDVSKKEVVFFGKTIEGRGEFAGISQKIDIKNDKFIQSPAAGLKWYGIINSLLGGMPKGKNSTNEYLHWVDFNVGYAYRVGKNQGITDATMFKLMTMMDFTGDQKIAYNNAPIKMGESIGKGNSYKNLYVELANAYRFTKRPTIPFDQFPYTYKQYGDREMIHNLIGDVTLDIYPRLMAKKKPTHGDIKRWYPIDKDGLLRGGYHGDTFSTSFFKILARQNYKYNENIDRMVDDPIYYTKKSNRKLISDMGLPVPYPNVHEKLKVDDKMLKFLEQEYFNEGYKIDDDFDLESMVISPEVVITFDFDIANENLSKTEQKQLFHKLTTGLDEFFCVENEDKLRDVMSEITEFIYEKHKGTDGWIEYKEIMDVLLPPVDNSAYQIPDFDISKKINRRKGRDCYFAITKRGLRDLNDFVEDNNIEWEENTSAGKGRPYNVGDRINKLPVGVEIEAILVDGKTGESIEGASIEVGTRKTEDVTVTNINKDNLYKIQVRNFYHVDDKGNETPIKASQYNDDRKNSYPKTLRGWLVDGKDANIGLNLLLPEPEEEKEKKPHKAGDDKPKENKPSQDDLYRNFGTQDIFVKYQRNNLVFNVDQPVIDKICRDNSNYPPNARKIFNELMQDIDAKAREVNSKDHDSNYWNMTSDIGSKSKDKKKEFDNLYDNDFKNWLMNEHLRTLVDYDPRIKTLINYFNEYNEEPTNTENQEMVENEVDVEKKIVENEK